MLKVLFDTNVLISAFLTDGLCSKLVLRANKGEFELYTCPIILNEFEEKLRTQFSLTKAEIKEALTLIKEISLTVNPIESNVEVKGVCRDKDDDMVLTCALTAKVDFLVTGDRDLLIIGVYQGINIISPRAFELLFDSD
ncbi:MAG: putative toxin-antitoxin system toxin component, PIN family [Nitrospirae bacterium CG_4_10_14_0_8_um_filter_41_23]|nr:MAG: putative toxin-antitoxin system toxin component, PIN family [Nitrospirae bacterium CG11_big_fil_rev_8_21_14_0_20_41_14]PIV41094.1 MAG: putative toxin-antitoxin system toxin component, PIN family [Nitrospirae bacterium CG02_land_8_20_14_3_00_41_53]PIW86338.1 MAG: putative toxin-antitoxin system toxin component, PIN family [Nitrospirae bacterium CG_4_8_14_3_um_filter_41_47]PIY87514.1 MAG: putative toxin-antitoxin system toxin component, PIN family [Nitrospirae bacterium CG_4_10_14_0_8_um_f